MTKSYEGDGLLRRKKVGRGRGKSRALASEKARAHHLPTRTRRDSSTTLSRVCVPVWRLSIRSSYVHDSDVNSTCALPLVQPWSRLSLAAAVAAWPLYPSNVVSLSN